MLIVVDIVCACLSSFSPSDLQAFPHLQTVPAAAASPLPATLPAHHRVHFLSIVVARVLLQLLLWVHVLRHPL